MTMRRIAYQLMLATLVTIPFEDVVKLPGLGTVARLFGLAAFATWAVSALASGTMRKPDASHVFAYGLVVWVGLGVFWSFDPGSTLDRIETFLQLLALSLLVWDLVDSAAAVRASIQALVIGLSVAAGSVFVNFARGVEAYYGRFASSGSDPNYLAMTLALGMPFAWYLAHHSPRRALRIANGAYLPVAAVAVALTGSRGGLLATSVALFYILVTIRRLRPAGFIALLILLGVATATAIQVVPESSFERIASVDEELIDGDLNGRAGIWLEARDAFFDRPVLGIGPGASRATLPTGKVGHNVVITVALELGIVGLALFVGFVAGTLRYLRSLPTSDRRLWLSVVAVWGVGSLSLSLETRKLTWVLFNLVLVASVAARAHWFIGDATQSVQPSSSQDPDDARPLSLTTAVTAGPIADAPGRPRYATDTVGFRPLEVANPGRLLSVNTASTDDLVRVDGIGPRTAEAIVARRSSIGRYRSVDDLLDVPGIGPARLRKIRPLVRI